MLCCRWFIPDQTLSGGQEACLRVQALAGDAGVCSHRATSSGAAAAAAAAHSAAVTHCRYERTNQRARFLPATSCATSQSSRKYSYAVI